MTARKSGKRPANPWERLTPAQRKAYLKALGSPPTLHLLGVKPESKGKHSGRP